MISVYEKTEGEYLITSNVRKMNVKTIHEYLSKQSYWAENISLKSVERFMKYSLCYAVIYETKTVGFARIITDYTTFAYLADVFILPKHRGKGLSKILLEFIHENSELQGLRRWLLRTKDAHSLYEQFGWTSLSKEQAQNFMQKHNPTVYKNT
jgi:GNAT superfamily N-acetyltransferase